MRPAAVVAVVVALAVSGCATLPMTERGCIQILPEPGHEAAVHLVKAGQPVANDDLVAATADDAEANRDARRARTHAVASLPLLLGGVALSVVGVSLTADGANNTKSSELYVGAPMAGVGVAALVAGIVELKLSERRGVRAVDGYNQRHPDCR